MLLKMETSKYIECLLTFILSHYSCSSHNIEREVCLEKPFAFVVGYKACQFTLADAKQYFESDTGICSQKCLVRINNLEDSWYTKYYRLTTIALDIEGLSEDLNRFKTRCSYPYYEERTLEIICKTDSRNEDIQEDLCTLTKKCKDESKTCLLKGKFGICTCKHGYIGFGTECLKGNLKLNETCKRHEQCSDVFGSVCQNNICVCRPEYAPMNESECLPSHSGGNSSPSIRDQKGSNIVLVSVGSIFGGLILGVFLNVLVVIIYQHVRNGTRKNTAYETERDAVQIIPTVNQTNERRVINVSPLTHSDELPMKRNFQESNKRWLANNDVNDEIYNQLHEKKDDPDIDDNYDHAHGNINLAMDESDYSNLNAGRRKKESDVSTS